VKGRESEREKEQSKTSSTRKSITKKKMKKKFNNIYLINYCIIFQKTKGRNDIKKLQLEINKTKTNTSKVRETIFI